jgi:TPR repeat protein
MFIIKLFIVVLLTTSLIGIINAGYDEGYNAYMSRDYKIAKQELLPLAKDGNPEAQYLLYRVFQFEPPYNPKVPQKAINWLKESAKQDYVDAVSTLALVYEDVDSSSGVMYDLHKANELHKRLIKLNKKYIPHSYNSLGSNYYELGDADEAIKWYKKAANFQPDSENSIADAYLGLSRIYGEAGHTAKAKYYAENAFSANNKFYESLNPKGELFEYEVEWYTETEEKLKELWSEYELWKY